MKPPFLSICIATYNRAAFIGETLDSIIGQLTDEGEMVVGDGASTDATRTVVERYAAGCAGLRYIRLPEKGGVDQDFCKAIEYARGEYCWLFSGDDLFQRGGGEPVLRELRNGHSLVVVNADVSAPRFLADRIADGPLRRDDGPLVSVDLEGLFR